MDIGTQFNLIAEEYDANRKKFIPCFDDFYKTATKMFSYVAGEPKRVLDLGAGTGLLTYFWAQSFPNAEFVLVDIAKEMLKIARERFRGNQNISYFISDYAEEFPDGDFDAIVSALSVHHLENEEKQRLFRRVYDKLPSGGIFVNYDQFCAGQEKLNDWYDSAWERQLISSGLTAHDIELWRKRRTLDNECSVEEETEMLCKSNFKTVKCIYSCMKFSVILAIK